VFVQAGFFTYNCLIIAGIFLTLYFFALMALTRADAALIAAGVPLLPLHADAGILFIYWIALSGFLIIAPLAAIYAMDAGVFGAIKRLLMSWAALSPVFGIFETQTKVRA